MKSPLCSALAWAICACPLAAVAGITFGPVKGKPGESIRLETYSETPGGNIQQSVSGKNTSGTINITRERDLVWTFREAAADGTRRGMVRVSKITTTTKTKIEGIEDKAADTSPLTGKMFAMSKTPTGDWKFELDGSVPLTRARHEIEELKIYLKRDWFPAREVNVGDSWEFDPAWVKHIIEKDLSKAQTVGTMRLRQVRSGFTGRTALIDVTIRSTGANFKADGSEASANIDLTGQVKVNLNTMLDEELELTGTVRSSTKRPGETKSVTLPVKLKVNKSFVREPAAP